MSIDKSVDSLLLLGVNTNTRNRGMKIEAGGKRQEDRDKRQEARNQRQEVRGKRKRRLASCFLLLASLCCFLFLVLSCAYYNTFYNAEKYYKEGVSKQKINPSQAKPSFDKAIEKSALVISKYPHSKYTPEALFIIGMSYYYIGDYIKAIPKFENLLLVFPNSRFASEANLYWAAALIETNEFGRALEHLSNLYETAQTKPVNKGTLELASFKIGQIYFLKKDYESAVTEFKSFTNKYPKSESYKEGLLLLADAQKALKLYPDAINTYEKYLAKIKTQSVKTDTARQRIQGVLRLAECLIESKHESEGLQMLDEIIGADTLESKPSKLDSKTYLDLGRLFLRINDAEKARPYLKKVRTNPDIVESYYLLANSYESESEFSTAKAYYDSVVMKSRESEWTTLAQSRLELLKLVVGTAKPPIVKNDTEKIKKDSLIVKKDTLVVKKDTIEEYPEPDTVPIESIIEVRLPKNPDVWKSDFNNTDTIKPAEPRTSPESGKLDTTPVVDSAAVQFHLAEIYNLNLKQYERAIGEYKKVFEKYPQNTYAPKALFAQAWIYKNILGAKADTSQYSADFKRVLNTIINRYPNTEYAAAAQDMLK